MRRIVCLLGVVLAAGCGGASMDMVSGQESYGPEMAPTGVESGGEEGLAEATMTTTPPAGELASDASGDGAGTPPNASNLLATTVTTRRGGGGDGERDPNDPIQIPDLPAPLLIYTADMRMEVPAEDVTPTLERIIEGAVSLGGYLAGRTDSSVSIRIPSRLFREGLAEVEQLGEVKSRRVTAQDVSEEYHDLDVRLSNLRGLRRRLESFLDRASTIEEALRVQTELERVSMQIDQAEGRLRYLRSRVAFSLVTVHVSAAPVAIEAPEPPPVVVEAPPPPPPPRLLNLPIEWLNDTGLGRLLDLT